MADINERKYIAISIKHSMGGQLKNPSEPKDGKYTLWGKRRTADNEERCFGGYTDDIDKCELYSLNDFLKQYGNSFIKCDEPVPINIHLCRKYKKFDTVLIDIEEYKQYLKII